MSENQNESTVTVTFSPPDRSEIAHPDWLEDRVLRSTTTFVFGTDQDLARHLVALMGGRHWAVCDRGDVRV